MTRRTGVFRIVSLVHVCVRCVRVSVCGAALTLLRERERERERAEQRPACLTTQFRGVHDQGVICDTLLPDFSSALLSSSMYATKAGSICAT